MDRIPPKSVKWTAAAAATGGAIGAAVGAGIGSAGGNAARDAGALIGGVVGSFSGAIAQLSRDDSVGGRTRAVASALWDVTATFAGSALSLGTAFNLQAELTSLVIQAIEADRGTRLDPSERALVKAAFDGLSWSALSPSIGFSAAMVGSVFNMLRRAINAAVEQCGATAPLQRVTSPGYMMAMMDWAALSLAVGAAVRSGQGTFAALQGHPFEVTASSALDSPPEAWVAGIGGAAAVAMGYLCTGLSERLRGGLTMAAFPAPFSLADARDLMISRMTSMARSGLVQVGAMPGMLMWTLRAVLTSPGGVLDLMGTPHRAIAASSAALTAATIGPMANEWFTQARRNDRGAPGEGMQNQINLNANIPVQSRRWRAEFAEARAERAADRDGDVATEILRDVSEVLGTVMCVGSGLSAVQHSDFRVPESAMDEFLEMSAAAGAPAFAAGFVLQMVALRAATGPWGELLGRNDPQSQRASSNLVAGLIGAASAGAARWDAAVIPAAAAGAAAEALLEVAYRRTTAADHKYPVEAAVAPNNIDGLIHNGRGRRVGESFLEFQASKWAENIRDPILGRPPGADAAAVPLAPAGEDGAAADPLAVPVPIPVVPGNGAGNLHLRVNKKGTPARENDRPTRPRIHAIPASNILPSGGEADGIEAKGQDREMRTLTHFAAVPHSPPDPAAEPPSLNSSFNGIAADRG